MKILWAKIDFLHPTNRGGQIRTLEMLRRLHARHEIHYVAYDDPSSSEGRERACEYSSRCFPVVRPVPARGSPRFIFQMAENLASPLPLAVGRYRSREMQRKIATAISSERYDTLVADFLSIAPNFPDLSRCVLFQHNVETRIWNRHAAHGGSAAHRVYFGMQARRMQRYEQETCQTVRQVVSVSPQDTALMRELFGVTRIADVPTGVDLEYFRRPAGHPVTSDIVFVGAMDWRANIDGAQWFMSEVLPRVRETRPDTTVTFAGRNPSAEIRGFANGDRPVRVTGTVADIRPFVWGSRISIVPLRIGGGTRLKIYEAMAAGVPVIATPVGAEGLAVTHGRDIVLAESAADFARATVRLLDDDAERQRLASAALDLVAERFSWESVARRFEDILEASRY